MTLGRIEDDENGFLELIKDSVSDPWQEGQDADLRRLCRFSTSGVSIFLCPSISLSTRSGSISLNFAIYSLYW
jgi:hypothetical protein